MTRDVKAKPHILAVDLGGTHIRIACVDVGGNIKKLCKLKLEHKAPEYVLSLIAEEAPKLSESTGMPFGVCGLGVAAMLRGQTVAIAPNLGWREEEFGQKLEKRLGLPTFLFNDLSTAAWGEFSLGAAQGFRDSLTVFIGSGVGSALISRRRLIEGAKGMAGELGHMKLSGGHEALCGCGQQGCLEAYAGGKNLKERMAEQGLEGGAAELEAAAQQGNPVAQKLYAFVCEQLGLAVANAVTLLNPGVLVLGGGMLVHCPGIYSAIEASVRQRASSAAQDGLAIRQASLGDNSGLLGAALLAAERSKLGT
ncbi:MAG: ROK family protein [Cystobacterineae bacterium]|nr:ROK family protein [Cystobacterineae bacterium]